MNEFNKTVNSKKFKKIFFPIIIVLVVLILGSMSSVVVPAGNTGVVVTLGKVSEGIFQEGFHLKVPFIQKVVIISNKIQKQEVAAAAVSKDLQTVSSNIAVNFRVGLVSSASIYKNIGADYQSIVLLPAVQESMKSVSAKYTAEELITLRSQVGEEIKETLENKVNEYGIVIEKFNIVNFDFSVEFNDAIEAKQVAEQNLIKTKTEQEQEIVISEADAKMKLIDADAESASILKKAEAQAKANKLLTESLSDTLVEYQKVQKWDGQLPMATGGSSILDFRTEADTAE